MGTHKCFKHKNIIRLECWNWTKDEVVWWWGNWTNWNLHLGNRILALDCHFVNMCHAEKFQIADPLSLVLWFSKCWNHLGVSNLEFAVWWFFTKWWPFFHFLHNGQCQIVIYVESRKNRDPNFRGVSTLEFYCRTFFCEMGAILSFIIHVWWLSPLKSAEWWMQIFCWFSFPIIMSLHPRFGFNIQAWQHLKHLCRDIHTWWSFCT